MPESIGNTVKKLRKDVTRNAMFAEFSKLPPQAVDVEEAVLGALMLEKDAITITLEILHPESFYKNEHQEIYRAITNLFEKSQPIDILTVTNELRLIGTLDSAGGVFYISELTNRVGSAANIEFHSRIVAQKYILRKLIEVSSHIQTDAYEETTDVFELLDKAEQELFSITQDNMRSATVVMGDLLSKAVKQMEEAGKNKEKFATSVPSGFTELDRVTSGWQKSDLIILAARPGMGKTAFVMSMARNAAVRFKKPVAIFSLEMSSLQLVQRLISSETEIDSKKIKTGDLEAYEWAQFNKRITELSKAPIFIDDTPALNVFELRAKCRRLVKNHGIEMIIIDYLQLMGGNKDGKQNFNREQEISTISRSLKGLAKELNVPVIALSQLSRQVEQRGGAKRPMLSDLRESGSIEQDADQVLFIYRPEYYKLTENDDGMPTNGLAEIIIAKNRHGELRTVNLSFEDTYARFSDYGDHSSSYAIDESSSGGDALKSITRGSSMNSEEEEAPF